MAQKDLFLEIAMTKHPGATTDKEVKPIKTAKMEFQFIRKEMKDNHVNSTKVQIDAKSEKCQFIQGISALKKQYIPFMEDYVPYRNSHTISRPLNKFRFRYLKSGENFTERNDAKWDWEEVTIPDYRGPAHENGKWRAYYVCNFSDVETWRERTGKRVVLQFQCVDYIAKIFVNGNFIGMHEGFFAPFSFDITSYLQEENELVILCENDIPILGEGPYLDGDKIYAATGPGWDDPFVGWHHCPAGAGVFGKVKLELRPELFVKDVFVRPYLDSNVAEVRVGIQNYTDELKMNERISLILEPRNYHGDSIGLFEKDILCIGSGSNEFRYYVPISSYRLWDTETPWLYEITVSLTKNQREISCLQTHFGIKEFKIDERSKQKGRFFLNKKPIVLRGANEMGHLQQCVMKGDFEQLLNDILIAKYCHLNYYRVTQRPVQEEIYDYFDMLGMMHQCDFPLFSYLRRSQFAEAIRQVIEMEHLIRSHVSTVMVTFINEPVSIRKTENPNDKFSKRYEAKGHRHLLRDELEAFFVAARKAVYVENPDRVIKNVEGDYDGPTAEGMPDFHCYTMWYTSHGQPIGKLMRGYLPPVKKNWMIGCGEYGAEGLDNIEVMKNRYPKEWLKTSEDGTWLPDNIIRAQTYSLHGDWYPEQRTLETWIMASQKHQALAIKLMTDAFRRRGDIINQTAVHLLIDAWPAGWMKALVGCDRVPKPAYYAYREALTPLRLSLYSGRKQLYEGETWCVECWICNDTSDSRILKISVKVKDGNNVLLFAKKSEISATDVRYVGVIPVTVATMDRLRTIEVTASLLNEKEERIHTETISLQVFPRKTPKEKIRTSGKLARIFASVYPLCQPKNADVWISDDTDPVCINCLLKFVETGGRGILLLEDYQGKLLLGKYSAEISSCGDRFFVDAVLGWKAFDISMIYNADNKYIDTTADKVIQTDMPGKEIFFTYQKHGFLENTGFKKHLPVAYFTRIGKGSLVITTLKTRGRLGVNCDLDRVFERMASDEDMASM